MTHLSQNQVTPHHAMKKRSAKSSSQGTGSPSELKSRPRETHSKHPTEPLQDEEYAPPDYPLFAFGHPADGLPKTLPSPLSIARVASTMDPALTPAQAVERALALLRDATRKHVELQLYRADYEHPEQRRRIPFLQGLRELFPALRTTSERKHALYALMEWDACAGETPSRINSDIEMLERRGHFSQLHINYLKGQAALWREAKTSQAQKARVKKRWQRRGKSLAKTKRSEKAS